MTEKSISVARASRIQTSYGNRLYTRQNTNAKLANDWAPFKIFPSTPRVTYCFPRTEKQNK